MSIVRLIDSEYVYNHTVIDLNVDANLLNKYIDICQDIYIQQSIGNTLYQKIMADISTGYNPDTNPTGSLTGQYLTLLVDYIQRTQALWVVYEVLPFINYRLSNKSVAELNSEFSKPTDIGNVQYLRSNVKGQAEFYAQRIREFIINNQALFPEYFQYLGINRITPNSNNYFMGMWLPRYNKYDNSYNLDKNNNNDNGGCCC